MEKFYDSNYSMGNCNSCKATSQEKYNQITAQDNKQNVKLSSPDLTNDQKLQQIQRKQSQKKRTQMDTKPKRGKAIAFIVENQTDELVDNVIINEGKIEVGDRQEIKKNLRRHFIFSQLPQEELDVVINSMRPCKAKGGQYIFKQGDKAGSYYVILEGSCQVEIDNVVKRNLSFGDSFGDLAILYRAPRSASVKAVTECQLAQIGRGAFLKVTQQINAMHQKQNRKFLQILEFYRQLNENQKNVIASSCVTMTFQEGQTIYNSGDQANSLYIIKSGTAVIKDKNIQIHQKQSFQESSIMEDGAIRSHTLLAKTKLEVISISKQSMKAILGDNIKNILIKNLIKKIILESKLYDPKDNQLIEQSVNNCILHTFKAGDIVLPQGTQSVKVVYVNLYSDLQCGSSKFTINKIVGIQDLQQKGFFRLMNDAIASKDGVLAAIKLWKKVQEQKDKASNNSSAGQDKDNEIKNIEKKMLISDLYVVRQLRSGNFGQVIACYHPKTQKMYAVKVLQRAAVQKEHLIQYVINQEEILRTAPKHPFLVGFYKLIKDTNFVYLIMQYVQGEDLFDIISRMPSFDEKKTRFIASQLLLVLEHLHSRKIIYRDLKPQNIMLGADGYVILVDMGTAKRLKIQKRYRTKTIIGTPHYMAPQIIIGKGYSFQVDLWSLGVIIYQLLCGKLPFGEFSEDPFIIYEDIMNTAALKYPRTCNKNAKMMIEKLLNRNPQNRSGNGYEQLKKHSFFIGIDWNEILNKEVKSFYKPEHTNLITEKQIREALKNQSNRAQDKIFSIRNKKN